MSAGKTRHGSWHWLAVLNGVVGLCMGQVGAAQAGEGPALWVSAAPVQDDADAANQLIQACWVGNDHLRMSACVARTAHMARAELQRAEADFRQRIQHATGRSSAQRRALASLGNGEVDHGLACEAVLDRQRVQALQADAGYW